MNKYIPNSVLLPIQVPLTLPRTVFLTRDQKVGVRTHFVQEEPLDLQCWSMTLAMYVVEDVPKILGILTLEFWATWEHSPSLPEYMLMRRQLLAQHTLVILQRHPLRLLQSFVTETNPVQQRLHRLQSRLLQCHLGARLVLETSEILVLTPHFCDDRSPSMKQNCTFFSVCFQNNLLFVLDFVQLPSWTRLELLPFLVTAAFATVIFIAWGKGINLCTKLWCAIELYPLPAMRSSKFSVEMVPNVVSWTHEPPQCTQALFLESCWIPHSSLQFPEATSASLFLFLQSIAASNGASNFLLAFLTVSLYSQFFGIDEITACRPSSTVEIWFRVCPILLLFLLSGFPILDQTSGQKFSCLVGGWIFVSLLPNHIFLFWGFFQ